MKIFKVTYCLIPILFFYYSAYSKPLGGFNLTESDNFVFEANPPEKEKSNAQKRVDEAKQLGTSHIILNLIGRMTTGTGNEVLPVTPPSQRGQEARRILSLIKYIQSQQMTVGLRPIFFVVGPQGEFPYFETVADGTKKLWWHGNIQPQDPNRWFDSFRTFLDSYISIARLGKVEEFTIGAELYSLTVGIEDQWKEHPYGFPGQWLSLLRYIRGKLPQARLMYDVNFTDDNNSESGFQKSGGELERWRYRLVDLANPSNEDEKKIWLDLVQFWSELDAIGIDMYRNLASRSQEIPTDYQKLIALLKQRADSYASQMDTTWFEISSTVNIEKPFIFKEVGYRSVEKGFIDPFTYVQSTGEIKFIPPYEVFNFLKKEALVRAPYRGFFDRYNLNIASASPLNLSHQAAALEAFLGAFWDAEWPWFGGVSFWDLPIDPIKHGPKDPGFSPLGKPLSEKAIQKRYQ